MPLTEKDKLPTEITYDDYYLDSLNDLTPTKPETKPNDVTLEPGLDPHAEPVAPAEPNKFTPQWWGDFELDEYQVGRWNVGPTTLSIYRLPREWRLVYSQGDDPLDTTLDIDVPAEVEPIDIDDNVRRYMFNQTQSTVTVTPVLADRPLVVRPAIPFAIETHEEITLYVSLPLWLRISVAGVGKHLYEVPSYRPSDTWFGGSTVKGELCYAARTPGQLNVDELPKRPYRVIAPIVLRNRDAGSLILDRIKIPVQYLALYRTKDTNEFWTQRIILEQRNKRTRLQLGWGSPQETGKTERIIGARERARRGLDIGAFGGIFKNTKGTD
ncbi:MAG: hypothetical protein AAF267_11555 [Deinococcota bacterium]